MIGNGVDRPRRSFISRTAVGVCLRAPTGREEGEEIEFDGVRIRIERVDNTRIMSARVTVLDAAEAAESIEESEPVESGGGPEATPNDAE